MKDFPELTIIQMVRLKGQVLIGAWIDLYDLQCRVKHQKMCGTQHSQKKAAN